MYPTRPRRTNSSQGTLLNTIRANTVTFETSFYCRALRTWNTLPAHLRNVDYSVVHFKNEIFNYYLYLTKSVYDVDTPKTYKSVSQRGRRKEGEGGRVRSAKGNQSIKPPPFFPTSQSPTPGLLGRLQECCYQVSHYSAIDQVALSNVLLIRLSMFPTSVCYCRFCCF